MLYMSLSLVLLRENAIDTSVTIHVTSVKSIVRNTVIHAITITMVAVALSVTDMLIKTLDVAGIISEKTNT